MSAARIFCAVVLAAASSSGEKILTPSEQDRALAAVREYGLHYWQSLPGFVSTQLTYREHQPTPIIYKTNAELRMKDLPEEFKRAHYTDVIEEELIVSNGQEHYRVLKIDDKISPVKHEQLGSTLSAREFGSIPERILDPRSGAKVQWVRSDKLHGRQMNVLTFEVPQSAGARYSYPGNPSFLVAYSGLLYTDAETNAVMRVETHTAEFPSTAFVRYVTFSLDYKATKLGGREVVLPAGFKLHWERRYPDGASLAAQQARNIGTQIEEDDTYGEYKNYRAFTADSTLSFDAAEPSGEAHSTITFGGDIPPAQGQK